MFLKFKKYGLPSIYDGGGQTQDTDGLELDEVNGAGCLRLNVLRRSTLIFCITAISLMTDLKVFSSLFSAEVVVNYGLQVNERYKRRADLLQRYGLTKESTSGEVKFLSTYFEVRKGGHNGAPDTARAIFNGKRLSKLCSRPETVNLPEIREGLEAISALHLRYNKNRSRYVLPTVICADIRHWFHEIEVGPDISQFFGLRFGQRYFRWATLPMGWSHSPRVAQCLAWAALLTDFSKLPTEKGDEVFPLPKCLEAASVAAEEMENPPAYIYLKEDGREMGFAFLWYDNLTVVSYSNDASRDMKNHLLNLEKTLNLKWKEIKVTPPHKMNCCSIETGDSTFLGLQLGVFVEKSSGSKRKRDSCPSTYIVWRHDPEKALKWSDTVKVCLDSPTRRNVARLIGLMVWDTYLAGKHLCEISETLDLMKMNSTAARNDWDLPSPLDIATIRTLGSDVKRIAHENTWHHSSSPPVEGGQTVRCASDSDMKAGGRVVFDGDGNVMGIHTKTIWWKENFLPAHIFLKELLASILTIEYVLRMYPNVTRIELACDNTTA